MARVISWTAVIVALVLPNVVQARWWHHRRVAQTAAYYCAVPLVYAPLAPTAVPVVPYVPSVATPPPAPVAPPVYAVPPTTPPPALPNYAQPSTAPPSSGPAPYPSSPNSGPVRSQGLKPSATTDHYFDSFVIASKDHDPVASRDRKPVWFWNMTGHDVTLRVAGQRQTVAAGKRMNLTLARHFVWQLDDREPQAGNLPEDGAGLDIIIHR